MNKLKALLFSLAFLVGMSSLSHATNVARTAKDSVAVNYGSVLSTGTQAVTFGSFAPAVVYQVILGTGAVTDYLVLYDTNACQGYTAGVTQTTNQRGPRFYSTSTANADFKFDPPLQFFNGLCVGAATGNVTGSVTFEPGRGVGSN